MPSYRVTMTIGALAPGATPAQLLPTAKSAAAELTVVEAAEVQVVAGQARLVVRFAADDAELAQQIAQHVAAVTTHSAHVNSWLLTTRTGTRWNVVR